MFICSTDIIMSTLSEQIKIRKRDLVKVTNCTVTIIATFEAHLDDDLIEEMKMPLPRGQKAEKFWEAIKFHDAVTLDMLREAFKGQNQTGVLKILEEINEALSNAYNLGAPLVVKITKRKPTELITRNPFRYDYDEYSPGIAILLNITRFNDPSKTRDGAQQDSEYLRDVFGALNFNVQNFSNRNECFKVEDINEIVQNDVPAIIGNRAPSCFIGFIGSHMEHGKVLLSDGNRIGLHKDILKPIHDNPVLEGVPKIFIVQGCRQNETREELPRYRDTIICYSTLPGETSQRDAYLGSLYIRTLTEVLMREAYRSDLKTMLDMVRNHMIQYLVNSKQIEVCQIPHYQAEIFGFNKSFYFNIP